MKNPLTGVDNSEQSELPVLAASCIIVKNASPVAEQLPRRQRMFEFPLIRKNVERFAYALKGQTCVSERLYHGRLDQSDEWNRPLLPGPDIEGGDHRVFFDSLPTRLVLLIAVRPCAQR